jgi:nucleoid-associated protein YgaU
VVLALPGDGPWVAGTTEDAAMRMRMRGRARFIGAALALTLTVAGCGGDDEAEEDAIMPPATPSPTAEPAPEVEPTPEPEEEAAGAAQTYVVESGDTLSGIAQRFGVTVDAIVEASGLEDPDRLAIGDELTIPPPP